MSKELEAFESIMKIYGNTNSLEGTYNYFLIIKKALQRLEAIDNANPSEALECLERIDNTLCLNNIKGKLDFGIDTEEHTDCDSVIGMTEDIENIKQALLKAKFLEEEYNNLMEDKDNLESELFKQSEPKQYLKWEDLEFMRDEKVMTVKMGDTVYKILYRYCYANEEVQLLSEDKKLLLLRLIGRYKYNIQLFNDLHLERVE